MKMSHKIAALIPIIIGLIVYIPSLFFDLLHWDDYDYIITNPLIKDFSAEGIKRIFTTPEANAIYSPMVLLSWAINYEFFGMNAFVFHLTDVILHAINGYLCFRVIYLIFQNKNLALFAAVFFIVHPLSVEAVVWATARKDNLYVFFFLSATLIYLKNITKPSLTKNILLYLLFLFAILSKTVAITLPAILVIIDLKKGLNFKKSIKQKTILFGISIGFVVWGFWAQKAGGAMSDAILLTFSERILFAFSNVSTLAIESIIPWNLSPFHPRILVLSDYIFASITLTFGIIFLINLFKAKKLNDWQFGILWFLIILAPVSQIIPIGMAQYGDRYAYLSLVGAAIVCYKLIELIHQKVLKRTLSITLLSLFTFLNMSYQPVWKNDFTLWEQAIKDYPNSEVGYNNLAMAYKSNGNLEKAMSLYHQASKKAYKPAKTLNNIGFQLIKEKQLDLAMTYLRRSEKINPNYAGVYLNIGNVFYSKKMYDSALTYYLQSAKLDPNEKSSYMNIGLIMNRKEKFSEATQYFTEYIKNYPNYASAYKERAFAYLKNGLENYAHQDLIKAKRLNPKLLDVSYNLGVIQMNQRNFNKAILYFEDELKLSMNSPKSKLNIGVCLMNMKEFDRAINVFDLLEKEYPNWHLIYENRAVAYEQIGKTERATLDKQKAKKLKKRGFSSRKN